MKNLPLLVLIKVCLSASVFCGEVFVATTGVDAPASGSAAAPYATITYAVNNVADGSTIIVKAGTYNGQTRLDRAFTTGITIKSEEPYKARLRHTSTVVICYTGKNIAFEGFDVAHAGPGAGALVFQIQDLIDDAGGASFVSGITLRNNILHDSYNNDILKINNGAGNIRVQGNIFYNQSGSDEHMDVNSVTDVIIEDNIFFNDFAGGGRVNNNDTSGYIVVKDSNGNSDSNVGTFRTTVRRNVFLNWEGSSGSNFLLFGEDGNNFFEADTATVENNLFIGNSANVMRAAFGVKGCKDITFRNNTVTGNLPSLAFAMRLNREGSNLANSNIRFFNNIWSDPTGTMGSDGGANDFSDTPPADTASFTLQKNLYWNGGQTIPLDAAELVNIDDDATAVTGNPLLGDQTTIALPRWNENAGMFGDGSTTIRQAFERLVSSYGTPAEGSAALDVADAANLPSTDILGNTRPFGSGGDIGAVERGSSGGGGGGDDGGGNGGGGTVTDSDNDGTSDADETAAGTDPNSAASVPATVAMTVTKLRGKVNFAKPGKDSIQVAGTLPAFLSGFDASTRTLRIDVGGVALNFTIDDKGKAKSNDGSVMLKLKPATRDKATKKLIFQGGPIAYKILMKNGSYASTWTDEGVSSATDAKNAALNFGVRLPFAGTIYTATVPVFYTGKAGKSGGIKN